MRARRFYLLLAWAWCWCRALALQRPACPDTARCIADHSGHDEYPYFVDGAYLLINFNDGGYFSMKCEGNVTLDNSALPRFETMLQVNHVTLTNCGARSRSYADALGALNVSAAERLTVHGGGGELSRAHLAGLDGLEALVFTNLSLAPDAFEATPRLQRLRLDAVSPVAVERLPASLTQLVLVSTGVERLLRAELEHFSALETLIVRDDDVDLSVKASAPLKELALQVGSVRLDATLPHTLVKVTLYGWAEAFPVPWKSCGALDSLTVYNATARELPDDWLANCTRLRELKIDLAPSLSKLAPGVFRSASSLARLSLTRCALQGLPTLLLRGTKSLQFLDLSQNHLHELPNGFFAVTKNLTELNLTRNQLTNKVFSSVSVVTSLQVLRLDHNPQLGDACGGGVNALRGVSQLQPLKKLASLHLRNTSAHFVCRDWRESMPQLAELDLGANNIDSLTYSDLQFAADVTVELADNNVTQVLYSRLDYATLSSSRASFCSPRAGGAAPRRASRARVRLAGAALRCDCGARWAARALRDCPAHVRLLGAHCATGAELAAEPLERLVCAVAPRDCPAPAPCGCHRLEDERGGALVVTCSRANLTEPPALGPAPATDERWELRLAHNGIARLSAVDLPPRVRELDLRYNALTAVEEVTPLLRDGRRLWLVGNPLRCDCAAAAAIAQLAAHRDLVADYDELACVEPPDCGGRAGPGPVLLLALAPLLAAAAVVACVAARRPWRERLKAELRRLFCLPPPPAPADDRPYDAFISFSHHDAELVGALLARLEGGARPYRVCVHYRDWAPGGWIPAQIAASVRRSRRTVAVVSAHFLRSAWARAEFREAYGAALREAEPRLVVVLLDEPARLPLDAELRRYLAANTYVRWGDPWFWQKLRAALPPPRGRAAPAAGAEPAAASAEPLMLQLSPRSLALEAGAAA